MALAEMFIAFAQAFYGECSSIGRAADFGCEGWEIVPLHLPHMWVSVNGKPMLSKSMTLRSSRSTHAIVCSLRETKTSQARFMRRSVRLPTHTRRAFLIEWCINHFKWSTVNGFCRSFTQMMRSRLVRRCRDWYIIEIKNLIFSRIHSIIFIQAKESSDNFPRILGGYSKSFFNENIYFGFRKVTFCRLVN